MTTPTALARELEELRRLAAAVLAYGDLRIDEARAVGDDDTEEHWYWTATTGAQLTLHLDELEQHLVKIGVVTSARNLNLE